MVQYPLKWTLMILWHCIHTRFANQLGICPEFNAHHKKPPGSNCNGLLYLRMLFIVKKKTRSYCKYTRRALGTTYITWSMNLLRLESQLLNQSRLRSSGTYSRFSEGTYPASTNMMQTITGSDPNNSFSFGPTLTNLGFDTSFSN